ncbi:MAG: arylsulfatase [Opitutaceae bacterium]|nr:arylsulfatase [Opitutaceae bacterium]|tara:strand:- start:2818 stop:4287 length:1470 start_codon:yes stop_codon:yes gene_type:complete
MSDSADSEAKRPNIVFIITDQQRFDTIKALGYDFMDTPNLDRMVNEGVTFTNCHITAASCAPSRASLFTGYYPHTYGVLKNADLWQHSWIEDLNKSGYRCVNIGKMHTYPYHTPNGFHERYVVENKDRYLEERYYFDEWDKALRFTGMVKQQREQYRERDDYDKALGAFLWELSPETHSDNFVGDTATWWLNAYPTREPLFLEIGFPGPHPPYDPVPGYEEPYMKRDLEIQKLKESDLDNQPASYKELRQHNVEVDHDSVQWTLSPTQEQRQKQRAYYCGNMTMIDEKVGEIIQTLEDELYIDNTIVIFTSDHGDCLTDHGHSQKWTMYEQITRVPTIVWAKPGSSASKLIVGGGRKLHGLCQLMDVGPLILDLAGVEKRSDMEAQSLLPAVQGKDWTPRDYVYCEQVQDPIFTGNIHQTMIRNDKWKLVHFVDEEHGLLIDLENDPDEFNNLWDDSGHHEVKNELLMTLLNWRVKSGVQTHNLFSEYR